MLNFLIIALTLLRKEEEFRQESRITFIIIIIHDKINRIPRIILRDPYHINMRERPVLSWKKSTWLLMTNQLTSQFYHCCFRTKYAVRPPTITKTTIVIIIANMHSLLFEPDWSLSASWISTTADCTFVFAFEMLTWMWSNSWVRQNTKQFQ